MTKKREYQKFDDIKVDALLKNISIPLSVISNRELAPMEATIYYLKKELELPSATIAKALKRNIKTIATMYRRAMIKIENNGHR